MSKSCSVAQKRFLIAMPLGIAFGFLCAYLASGSAVGPFWWTPMMWTIVTNRLLIGLVVGLAGAYTIHPILRFPLPPFLRGCCLGAITSLPLAIGVMIAPTPGTGVWTIFWLTILAGAVYGLIIDLVATRWGGQGAELLK